MPPCKLDQIRALWATGDKLGALRIAATFSDRSAETLAMSRAWDAHQRPDFYRQLRKDPAAITQAGLEALAAKFGLASR